jgi:hypothetical protein
MSAKAKLQATIDAIAKLQAKLPELEAAAANEFDTSVVQPGVRVEVKFGRAEKVRTYIGTVIARKSQPKGGDVLRVQAGEGFDATIITVALANVIRVVGADEADSTGISADEALSTQG